MKAEAPVFSIQALKPAMELKGYNQYLPPSLKEKIPFNYNYEPVGEFNQQQRQPVDKEVIKQRKFDELLAQPAIIP